MHFPRLACLPLYRMPTFVLPPCIAAIISVMPAPALAIHRCELQGNVTYSDLPCPGSTDVRVDPAPPPARQQAASDAGSQRQAAELARLQQQRELRERQDQRIRDLAARGAAAREKKCRTLALQLRWREEDLRDASLRQEANARKRLRRTEEQYRDECR